MVLHPCGALSIPLVPTSTVSSYAESFLSSFRPCPALVRSFPRSATDWSRTSALFCTFLDSSTLPSFHCCANQPFLVASKAGSMARPNRGLFPCFLIGELSSLSSARTGLSLRSVRTKTLGYVPSRTCCRGRGLEGSDRRLRR